MTRVNHPTAGHLSYDVKDSRVDEWLAAGWVLDSPVEPAPAPEPAATEPHPLIPKPAPKRKG